MAAGAAAAATVVVRRARNEQLPARLEMERLVTRSERALNMTQVCVFDVEVFTASLHQTLAGRRNLKVKLHMAGGQTLLKWKAQKVEVQGNGEGCATFDARGGLVFEGGSAICFDLCEPRWMRRSLRLGGGQLPLQLVTGQVDLNSPHGRRWQIDLFDVDNPDSLIASLGVSIRLAIAKLEDVGGPKALRVLKVPERPIIDDSVFTFKEDVKSCTDYYTQVLAVKQDLSEAFKTIARGLLLARARGGTETPATTAGSDVVSEDDFSLADEQMDAWI